MTDRRELLNQLRSMQEKLRDGLAVFEAEASVGGGVVRMTLSGAGDLRRLFIDEDLMERGNAEMVADLIAAAHREALRKLQAAHEERMRQLEDGLGGSDAPGS